MAFGYHQNIGLKGLGASYSKDSFHSYGFNLAPILLLRKRRGVRKEREGRRDRERGGGRKERRKKKRKEGKEGVREGTRKKKVA